MWEGSQRRDTTPRAFSLGTWGARALLPQSVRSQGVQVRAVGGKKRGNSEQPRAQSLLCPISPSRDAKGIADCVAAWWGDSLTPRAQALAGFLLRVSHRSEVGRGEDKTSQLNFFLMVWWSVWHVNLHCPCSPAWLQWLLLTNSLPQTGKFCYLVQTCSNTLELPVTHLAQDFGKTRERHILWTGGRFKNSPLIISDVFIHWTRTGFHKPLRP